MRCPPGTRPSPIHPPILPSPTIPSSMPASKLVRGDNHAVLRQIPPQLRRILKMNRTHLQLPRTFTIDFPIGNEQTFRRIALGPLERHPVDSFVGVSDGKIAGTEESFKRPPQVKRPD